MRPWSAILLGVALAIGTGTGAASAASAADPQWGANQERPPLESPTGTPGTTEPSLAPGGPKANRLSSSTQSATSAATDWVLHGAGWGHGIGMSQYGAYEMARDGRLASQILAHYYTGTTYDAVADDTNISVNIAASAQSATVVSSALATGGGAFRVGIQGATGTMSGAAGGQVTFSRSGSNVVATCGTCTTATTLIGAKLYLVWDTLAQDKTLMRLGSTSYRDGTMWVTPGPSTGINVVNAVRLHDEYLDYIYESPWSWPVEALKAQAAAARGYALTKVAAGIRSACACHVYNTTADQVYGGYPSSANAPYWPNWRSAVRATGSTTTGYVSRYQGKVIQAFYSSSSGGRTENNEDVWQGSPIPYLRGVSDPWSLRPSNPARAWRQVAGAGSMASVFGLPDIARLDLSRRTVNGGVLTAVATSSGGVQKSVRGDSLRMISASGSSFSGRVNSTMIGRLTARVSGSDRYEVAANVAARIPVGAGAAVLASGEAAAAFDASVSGPLSAAVNGPLLLTRAASLPGPTLAELDRRSTSLKTVYVVGGPASVSEAVLQQLRDRGLTVERMSGATRFDVSANVAREIKALNGTVPQVVIASGEQIADALGASGPAAALGYPILLTRAASLPDQTVQALDDTGPTWAHIVGGYVSVSPTVQSQLVARGMTVRRHGGSDRYEVAAAVASYFRGALTNAEVVMTSGADEALADSLAAGSLQRLMLLTRATSLPDPTVGYLQTTPLLETVTVVGGPASVAAAALTLAKRA